MKYGGKADSLLYLVDNNVLVPSFFIYKESAFFNEKIK